MYTHINIYIYIFICVYIYEWKWTYPKDAVLRCCTPIFADPQCTFFIFTDHVNHVGSEYPWESPLCLISHLCWSIDLGGEKGPKNPTSVAMKNLWQSYCFLPWCCTKPQMSHDVILQCGTPQWCERWFITPSTSSWNIYYKSYLV